MSVAQTAETAPPETAETAPRETTGRPALMRWIAGGSAGVAAACALAIAFWPASEADKAYDDGQAFGTAVAELQAADTSAEVDDALTAMSTAAADTREHAGDAVADQVDAQYDALYRAADGFVGMTAADDDFEYEVYEYELDVALDDLATNAEDFRTTGPEVQQAFWDGYEDGLNGN